MRVWQAVARRLVCKLPDGQRMRMAADTIAWFYADQPPEERQARISTLGPRLLERIEAGQIGLWPVLYYHLLRFPALHGLRRWTFSGGARWGQKTSQAR